MIFTPGDGPYEIIRGDALAVLKSIPSDSIDAAILDCPYSSGAFTRGDRTQSPAEKYQQSGAMRQYQTFAGDNRDARSWGYWCTLWMSELLRIVKPHGYLLSFTDWRQLPTASDALQSGGWVWRGVISWDKTEGARAPSTGWFRHQCEYLVWGSKGVTRPATHGGPFPGAYRFPVLQREKFHLTGKPVALMRELVKIVPPNAIIIDPFCGSGTTGVGAILEGRRFLGIESDQHYYDVSVRRLDEAIQQVAEGKEETLRMCRQLSDVGRAA